MLGMSLEQLAAGATLLSATSAAVFTVYGFIARKNSLIWKLELDQVRESIKRLEKAATELWRHVNDLHDNAWRKEDQMAFKREIKEDMEKIADRLEKSFRNAVEDIRRGFDASK